MTKGSSAEGNGEVKSNGHGLSEQDPGPDFEVKVGFARMLQGGVIMDVTTAEEARVAEDAGAVAVMALERVPSDIRKEGGVARMAAIDRITSIQATVSIPTMAKVRIGHFQEARALESSRSTSSTRVKFSLQQTTSTTSIRRCSSRLLSVVRAISVKPCAVSRRVRPFFGPKGKRGQATSLKRCATCD